MRGLFFCFNLWFNGFDQCTELPRNALGSWEAPQGPHSHERAGEARGIRLLPRGVSTPEAPQFFVSERCNSSSSTKKSHDAARVVSETVRRRNAGHIMILIPLSRSLVRESYRSPPRFELWQRRAEGAGCPRGPSGQKVHLPRHL